MSMLFRRPQGPTRINNVQLNQSNQGYPVPVVMGRGKLQQTILWVDGFTSKLIRVGSSKGFGGKDGNQYVYSADVLAGLCDGGSTGLRGIGDVWSGQSWLPNTNAAESYTIANTTNPSYTPSHAEDMTADSGVSYLVPVSGSYNDLAATGPVTLSGNIEVPYQRVPYVNGATLAAGTYSIDPATNIYYFSQANAGTTVQLYYSFSLTVIEQQQTAIIPSGLNVAVNGNIPFIADKGVAYYGTENPKNGQLLQQVSGTPTAAGTYSVDPGSYTVTGSRQHGDYQVTVNRAASYTFASADLNEEVMISYELDNSGSIPAGTQTSLSFELIPGLPRDAVAAILTTNYPGAALGYGGIAKVLYTPMDLGYGAQVQNNTFEVLTEDMWGGGIPDCNPVQCILQVLTNGVWGLGNGPIPFPTSAIDTVTFGPANAGGGGNGAYIVPHGKAQLTTDSSASSWFASNSFFITPVIDRQDTAASLIGRWLEAGMCATFISEGLMKLVPYGDTTTAGNGATWTAPSAFAAELDDTCFKSKTGQDPVKISCKPWMYNTVQIQWSNRANQYAPELTPAKDRAAINRYGNIIEDPQSWDFITTLDAALFAGRMRVKRSVYTRNRYSFTVPFRFGYLEPMDVISITTNSAWNSANNNTVQLIRCPARITKIVDNPDGTYDIEAEDLISGAHTPDGFAKTAATPPSSPNQYGDPGDTIPVIMDAPLALKIYSGSELWIGACGINANWGGCTIYASLDGTKYAPIGKIGTAARLGTLATSFPAGSDPDTTDTLVVNLQPGSETLDAGTSTDADNEITLCWLDGELLAYSAATLTGANQYSLGTYIRRGLMGTSASAHAAGAKFLRLDDTVFRYSYDSSWIGKTIYLKFQSFNTYGNSAQDLSTVTAYTYTPGGTNYPAPPIVTISQSTSTTDRGIINASGALNAVSKIYVTVTWTWPANFPTPSGFNIALFEGTDPTNTANYIAPITTVGESARSVTFAVVPNSSMTNVNAAVEAVYA